MTVIDYESRIRPEEFDEATAIMARTITSIRLELIDGKIRSRVVPDGDHGRIVQWLTRICRQSRPELWLRTGRDHAGDRAAQGLGALS
ncbi:hypothetical protein [Streptomyces sp. NPDC059134]|uniref:hypothetical protein n=1 Tax=Streptomyces sp. NPDC059134 TaxID=3346738 RepID=UPI00368E27FE